MKSLYEKGNYKLQFNLDGRFIVLITITGENRDSKGNLYVAYRTLEERVKAAAKAHPVVNPHKQKELLG